MMVKGRSKRFNLACIALAMLGGGSAIADGESKLKASIFPAEVPDGSLVRVTVTVPDASANSKQDASLSGDFEGQSFQLFSAPDQGAGVYEGYFGVPHSHKAGGVKVKIGGSSAGAAPLELSFKVVDGKYASEKLKVGKRHINPKKKDLEQIKRDQAEVKVIYDTIANERRWKGSFVFPIDSPVTSRYGTKRLFNGQLQSFHSGLDLRAPVGTPIHAAAPGVVVLAKELFFTGNTVMIDHGYGIVTLYAHMSKLDVKKGDRVETKQLLGLSGATGRVSGPHLHWSAIIHSVKVNPMGLIEVLR